MITKHYRYGFIVINALFFMLETNLMCAFLYTYVLHVRVLKAETFPKGHGNKPRWVLTSFHLAIFSPDLLRSGYWVTPITFISMTELYHSV